jgi:hypothetical protein
MRRTGVVVIVVQACDLPFDWLTVHGLKDGIVGPSEEPTPVGGARWTLRLQRLERGAACRMRVPSEPARYPISDLARFS